MFTVSRRSLGRLLAGVVFMALAGGGGPVVPAAYGGEQGAGASSEQAGGEGEAVRNQDTVTVDDSGALPFTMETKTFANGLRLVVVPFDSPGIVAYGTMVRVGSRNEVWKGRTGFAHFFEHMMFRGTERFPSELYQETLTKLGSDHNAFTSTDLTFYHLVVPVEGLEQVVHMEADRFMNLSYSEDDFKTEAGAIMGEYHMVSANPLRKMREVANNLAYRVHPYGHTVIGREADIKAMPGMYDFSREFFRRFYTPDNTTIFIAGDITLQKAEALVGRAYGDWDIKSDIPSVPEEPEQTAMKEGHINWPGATGSRLAMAWKVPPFEPGGDWAALQVAAEYLFGTNSQLYKKLVVEEQLVESLTYHLPPSRDGGLLRVDAVLRPGVTQDRIAGEINHGVSRVNGGEEGGVDGERLEQVKSRLYKENLAKFETPHAIITNLAVYGAGRNNPEDGMIFVSSLGQVAGARVARVVGKYLVKEGLTQVTLTGRAVDGGLGGDGSRKGGRQ